jgi:hypothetical protein
MLSEKKATSEPATKKEITKSRITVKMRMVVTPGVINKKVNKESLNIKAE